MRHTTHFNAGRELIYVGGILRGPLTTVSMRLVLDTGASQTLIQPRIAFDAGYTLEGAELVTNVETAIGKEHGHLIRAQRFGTLGFAEEDFPIHVFPLAKLHDVDGLIGLTFLQLFNLELRFDVGEIVAERIERS